MIPGITTTHKTGAEGGGGGSVSVATEDTYGIVRYARVTDIDGPTAGDPDAKTGVVTLSLLDAIGVTLAQRDDMNLAYLGLDGILDAREVMASSALTVSNRDDPTAGASAWRRMTTYGAGGDMPALVLSQTGDFTAGFGGLPHITGCDTPGVWGGASGLNFGVQNTPGTFTFFGNININEYLGTGYDGSLRVNMPGARSIFIGSESGSSVIKAELGSLRIKSDAGLVLDSGSNDVTVMGGAVSLMTNGLLSILTFGPESPLVSLKDTPATVGDNESSVYVSGTVPRIKYGVGGSIYDMPLGGGVGRLITVSGTSYTITQADAGATLVLTNAGACAITVQDFGLGNWVNIRRAGGAPTFAGSGTSLNWSGWTGLTTVSPNGTVTLSRVTGTVVDISGNMA